MVYLNIDTSNYKKNDGAHIHKLNDLIHNKKDNKVFLLIYMEGCGPCNMTRPEWKKIENVLNKSFIHKKDVGIIAIDKDLMHEVKHIKKEPTGFPSIWYVTNNGNTIESYEDSSIRNKDRTVDSFVEWIELKSGEKNISKAYNDNKKGGKKKRSVTKKRKWSLKYKRSINCKRPKGFSQKQYCKYTRKNK